MVLGNPWDMPRHLGLAGLPSTICEYAPLLQEDIFFYNLPNSLLLLGTYRQHHANSTPWRAPIYSCVVQTASEGEEVTFSAHLLYFSNKQFYSVLKLFK